MITQESFSDLLHAIGFPARGSFYSKAVNIATLHKQAIMQRYL